ncbi:hypothetical protein VB780_05310 [Leptolyngbya sp. CCNP1308]|uniref:hypothetical protein n=1 Tax=Leptolyngbya sp. CCNP1308 TaxID=3110255 RepID=UPI002B215CD1|nr:hypothetical protein [Leptolyngbya sp. CCNP1308]MEA5447977.1 hypothetical protein [Leptolyngbya sp. CCNP1308]
MNVDRQLRGPFRFYPQRPKGHGHRPLFSRNDKGPDLPQLSSLHRFPQALSLGMNPRQPVPIPATQQGDRCCMVDVARPPLVLRSIAPPGTAIGHRFSSRFGSWR